MAADSMRTTLLRGTIHGECMCCIAYKYNSIANICMYLANYTLIIAFDEYVNGSNIRITPMHSTMH